MTFPPPTPEEVSKKGVLPYLDPLERWEISQPGNVLRVFERGSRRKAGGRQSKPRRRAGQARDQTERARLRHRTAHRSGFSGTAKDAPARPAAVFPRHQRSARRLPRQRLQRLPRDLRQRSFAGTFRRLRCARQSWDRPRLPIPPFREIESGHPIRHQFTRSIPSSQCMVCHMHPGTNMVATYFGYTWWDNEMDGEHMWPAKQRNPSAAEQNQIQTRNPERSAVRGLWSDPDFLEKTGTPEFNRAAATHPVRRLPQPWLDFPRGHSSTIAKATCSTQDDKKVSFDDPDKFGKAVHLKDIHLEKGMHCIDCHFEQDSHGNGKLYGETRNAIEIDCVDCHGTIQQHATLITSGTAAPKGGTNLAGLRTPWQERRFYWKDGPPLSALHAGERQRVGSGAGARHHHARERSTTARNHAWPKPFSRMVKPGETRRQRIRPLNQSSRIPTAR